MAEFTKPFVHAASAIRVNGADGVIDVVGRIQAELSEFNRLQDEGKDWSEALAIQYDPLANLFEELVAAARADVGPRSGDVRQFDAYAVAASLRRRRRHRESR